MKPGEEFFGRGLALHKFERDLMTSTLKTCFQFVAGSDAGARVFLCAQEQPENNPFFVDRAGARALERSESHTAQKSAFSTRFGGGVKIRRHFR